MCPLCQIEKMFIFFHPTNPIARFPRNWWWRHTSHINESHRREETTCPRLLVTTRSCLLEYSKNTTILSLNLRFMHFKLNHMRILPTNNHHTYLSLELRMFHWDHEYLKREISLLFPKRFSNKLIGISHRISRLRSQQRCGDRWIIGRSMTITTQGNSSQQ